MVYIRSIWLIVLLSLTFATSEVAMTKESQTLILEWYGQSCFLLTLANGARIMIDPFDTTRIPYHLPTGNIDVCFSTHDHFDHNAVDALPTRFILRAMGSEPCFFGSLLGKKFEKVTSPKVELKNETFSFSTVPSFHDDRNGGQRGVNGIVRFTVAGITFVHLGDLGDTLTTVQIQKLKPVDILLIPAGGYFTLESPLAQKVVAELSPKLVIPMHYKTDALPPNFPIVGVDEFLQGFSNINHLATSTLSLSKETLPEALTIDVLRYHGQP
jgi:L-ascorbate metabolism protein UlaG (beta-lactamase superfamily)